MPLTDWAFTALLCEYVTSFIRMLQQEVLFFNCKVILEYKVALQGSQRTMCTVSLKSKQAFACYHQGLDTSFCRSCHKHKNTVMPSVMLISKYR